MKILLAALLALMPTLGAAEYDPGVKIAKDRCNEDGGWTMLLSNPGILVPPCDRSQEKEKDIIRPEFKLVPPSAFAPNASVYVPEDKAAGPKRIVVTVPPGSTLWIQTGGEYEIKTGGNGALYVLGVCSFISMVVVCFWATCEVTGILKGEPAQVPW